jgi:hypothetical protein
MKNSRSLRAAVGIGLLAVAGLTALAGSGTLTISLDPPGFWGANGGGEFAVVQFTGTDTLAPLGPGVQIPGAYFQTFCAQVDEHIVPGLQTNYTTSPYLNANPATPLSPGAAYLFSRFWDGLATNYDYTFPPIATSDRPGSATSLQLAMWYLLGEMATHPNLQAAYSADADAQAYVAEATAAIGSGAWTGIGNVRVLVTSDEIGNAQDLFIKLALGDGHTPGFWQNKNGQALINQADLDCLTNLCLVTPDGKAFAPKTAADVGKWITSNAVNMAYKLSTFLAAMKLNVRHGFVSGSDLVYTETCPDELGVAQIKISDLMKLANDDLCKKGHNYTVEASSVRTYQECLKTVLDRACNNLNWVNP